MGVPSFYRWLIERYPLILQDVIEEEPLDVKVPVDTIKPNPSCVEYDNLYLDMNIIIHPCFHPEDRVLQQHSVAPRAKMNQQRSRRFRAAKDAAEAASEKERLRQEFESEGKRLPPKLDSQVFDSNVVNSWNGVHVYSFICVAILHSRFDHDFLLLKVIPSDANVPGEGEHKIMSYIRLQKNHPGYNPNTCHFLYGLDADLIMLALATHEVHISILRETGDLSDKAETDVVAKKPYQFVNIWTLREYLEHDMQIPNSQLQKKLDRIIDDFIFICFFVGNDFLPHMPTLEIQEVRLGVQGWRERYYEEKFIAKTIEEMEQICRDVVSFEVYRRSLLDNALLLSWCLFMELVYPYHYAPFASDLKFLDKLDIKFELGSTFKQFNQLLAVLPSASAHALPECFRKLMTDPSSPIAELYPPDFEIDMNGKRYSWQGIAKLPFIEEQRLLDAAAKMEHSLTNEEVRRNNVLSDMLFVVLSYPLAELIRSLSSRTIKLSNKERATVKEKIDHGLSIHASAPPSRGMEDVLANQVICAIYKLPDDLRGSDIARPPPGVVLPKKTVQLADLKGGANLWHEDVLEDLFVLKSVFSLSEDPFRGDRLGKAAHRFVLQTISSQPDNTHINTEPALCPNTIFHNNQVSRKVPSLRGSAVQRKHPQSELALKKTEAIKVNSPRRRRHQSESARKRRKEGEIWLTEGTERRMSSKQTKEKAIWKTKGLEVKSMRRTDWNTKVLDSLRSET
ncbi:hypothetical protein Bca101_036804 [Brassica carinata]